MENKTKAEVAGGLFAIWVGIVSFFAERLWFDMGSVSNHRGAYVFSKILLMTGAYLFFITLRMFKNRVLFRRVFIMYFLFMFLMLLITWPGIWRWDEFFVLDASKYFTYNSYQHYFTSLFYMASLMLFPFPAGVVIMQILIVSVLTAVFVEQINRYLFHNKKIGLLCVIPFLFFPVIDSNLYPLRCSLYAFLEVGLMLFLIISIERLKDVEYKISNKICIGYVSVSIILAVWRSESFYYAMVAPIVFWIVFKKRVNVIKRVIVFFVIFVSSIILSKYQNTLLHDNIGVQNTVISTLPYIEYVVCDKELKIEEAKALETIDKVIDLEILEEKGRGIIWDSSVNLIRVEHTKEAYDKYLKAYAKLVFKHLYSFAKVQVPVVLQANGLKLGTQYVENTENLFSGEGVYVSENLQTTFYNQDLNRSIFPNLRKNVIIVMETLLIKDSFFMKIAHRVTYNAIIPMFFLMGIMGSCLKKRKFLLGILCGLQLLKAVILAGTIPGSAFMYWYSIYLIGYLAIFICLIRLFQVRRELNESD
ncbi:hypothetical protein [Lacrimispora algidixylanolytica]|uniref:Glycosyltransferase RgtA/B/C/D-like domain-containing protein n=1 Tax=Lacrimispora algidixylanolytica TaxID=94868 RepID=A0A419TBJ7_9FIRM|nr:hypothetical protein [Lacrimispora algidixylanolytica]RKD34840.1 hypothetical protein BET01_00290 [Lacrimispora algidixylanolytica]